MADGTVLLGSRSELEGAGQGARTPCAVCAHCHRDIQGAHGDQDGMGAGLDALCSRCALAWSAYRRYCARVLVD